MGNRSCRKTYAVLDEERAGVAPPPYGAQATELSEKTADVRAPPPYDPPTLAERIRSVYAVYLTSGDNGDLESTELTRLSSRMRSLLHMPDTGGAGLGR